MKNLNTFLFIAIAAILFTSCNDSTVGHSFDNTVASIRGNKNLDVEIATTTEGTIYLDASVVELTYVSGNTFTVNVDDIPTYTATYVFISHSDDKLKITNGNNVYNNKTSVEIEVNSSTLSLSINPGNIITSGNNIVIEEISGM